MESWSRAEQLHQRDQQKGKAPQVGGLLMFFPNDINAALDAFRDMGRYKSWRHADDGYGAKFYEGCCTFAANIIADDPSQAENWKRYL